MNLTDRQKIIAINPYAFKQKDVYDVMFILGSQDHMKAFGDDTWYVLMELRKAAQAKNIPIPRNFENKLLRLDNKVNEMPNKTPLRRVDDKLPPN